MQRIATLKPRISVNAPQRIATVAGTQRTRGSTWMRIRAAVLREHPHCAGCMKTGRIRLAQEVDHVVPLHLGGGDNRENLQPLCIECHAAKSKDEARQRGTHG